MQFLSSQTASFDEIGFLVRLCHLSVDWGDTAASTPQVHVRDVAFHYRPRGIFRGKKCMVALNVISIAIVNSIRYSMDFSDPDQGLYLIGAYSQ